MISLRLRLLYINLVLEVAIYMLHIIIMKSKVKTEDHNNNQLLSASIKALYQVNFLLEVLFEEKSKRLR